MPDPDPTRSRRYRPLLLCGLALLGFLALALYALGRGSFGRHEGPGSVTEVPLSPASVRAREKSRAEAIAGIGGSPKQILFGDLHVHTTFSSDAFVMSLPLVSGEGAHPPADACDFARHCAALDFWSINDHAESLTPEHWRETVASIRQCDAISDAEDPDVTAFLGWEWTQDGSAPENHWGHKNIVLKELAADTIPARPIGARHPDGDIVTLPALGRAALALLMQDRRTLDFTRFLAENADVPSCPENVAVRDLPASCEETTRTPAELFAKLDDWEVEAIVIPHGTAWGNTAPPGSSWDPQIGGANDDPARQILLEIYSGHGNSEEYRDFAAIALDADGGRSCPPPQRGPSGFLPNCWRAGEIIRERCLATGTPDAECEERARVARENHMDGGKAGFRTVLGTSIEDWLDSGQCRDCFLPAFDYRPRMSAQYMLARKNFSDASPRATRMGFIASSDNHTARPGTGYKEINRSEMTESKGAGKDAPDLLGNRGKKEPYSSALDEQPELPFASRDVERMSSYLTTGGLVAVHAEGRGRDSIWRALTRREVYGTSGDRILLFFDLLNPPGKPRHTLPMGSQVALSTAPRFRVRAVGARRQRPGCPQSSLAALGHERLHDLCRDECHHPSDSRKRIGRIEVIRVRPQASDGEPIAGRIEDPWLSFICAPDEAGCSIEFEDAAFVESGRDAIYYVRAIQEASPAVNGGNFRCEYDAQGNCISIDPCRGGGDETDLQDDCLSDIEERAWSSPIWVDRAAGVGDAPGSG
jgi:hypothetical protein